MLKLILSGNLGADPDMRYSAGGEPILRFNVASTFGVRDREGTWQDKTEWIQVVIFGKRAESLQAMLHKGMRVVVLGRMTVKPWLDRSNNPRAGLEVVADDVEFMSAPRREGDDEDVRGRIYDELPDDIDLPF